MKYGLISVVTIILSGSVFAQMAVPVDNPNKAPNKETPPKALSAGSSPTYTSPLGKNPLADSVVVNYWQLVRDIMTRIKAAPPRGRSVGIGLDTPTQEYPFDAFRNLRVLELNGVGAEATHIYDPQVSLWAAYRTMARQWRLAFEIGAAQRDRGAQPMAPAALLRLWRGQKRTSEARRPAYQAG